MYVYFMHARGPFIYSDHSEGRVEYLKVGITTNPLKRHKQHHRFSGEVFAFEVFNMPERSARAIEQMWVAWLRLHDSTRMNDDCPGWSETITDEYHRDWQEALSFWENTLHPLVRRHGGFATSDDVLRLIHTA